MDKKSILLIIMAIVILILAALIIVPNFIGTEYKQQNFTNFMMDIPADAKFSETIENYVITYKSEDIAIQYYDVSSTEGAFDYAEDRTIIQSSSEEVAEEGGISEWKIDKDGKTKFVCFVESVAEHGACVVITANDQDACMKMAQSVVFINGYASIADSNPAMTNTTDADSSDTNSSSGTSQNSSSTSNSNGNTNSSSGSNDNKVWSDQSDSYLYEQKYSDGNFRQYDSNGKLVGSSFEEDQASLGNPNGDLE